MLPGDSESRRSVAVIIAVSLFVASGCAPRARLAYSTSSDEVPNELDMALAQLSAGDKIRVRLVEGNAFEAKYKSCAGDSISVAKMFWKKQIVGRKLQVSDETTRIAIKDVHELHIFRHTTFQKIGLALVLVWGLSGIILMSSAMSD